MIIGISGACGSGKSSLSRELAERLNCYYIEMDKYNRGVTDNRYLQFIISRLSTQKDSDTPQNAHIWDIIVKSNPKISFLKSIGRQIGCAWTNYCTHNELAQINEPIILIEYHNLHKLGVFRQCDIKILVNTPRNTCIENIKKRNNYTDEDIIKLINCGTIHSDKDYDESDFDFTLNMTEPNFEEKKEALIHFLIKASTPKYEPQLDTKTINNCDLER